MVQYLELLNKVLNEGKWKNPSREGMPRTKSIFGHQMRFDLREGFPLVTTKEVNFKNIVTELLWFLRGDTNIKFLVDNGCNIWNEDAYNFYKKKSFYNKLSFETFIESIKNGDLRNRVDEYGYSYGDCGGQYGWLWRYQEKYKRGEYVTDEQGYVYYTNQVDQIKNLIEGLLTNAESRRHVISAWNPATLDEMALPACHPFIQFNCQKINPRKRTILAHERGIILSEGSHTSSFWDSECDKYKIPRYSLDCKFTMRSSDLFLGLPYNIASYALLTHILCEICNMTPGELICDLGDVHLYEDHIEAARTQLSKSPKKLPGLIINDEFWNPENVLLINDPSEYIRIISQIKIEDFQLKNYNPHPKIKAKLSTGLK